MARGGNKQNISSGATTYDGLLDTPGSKQGAAGSVPRVNANETDHEYVGVLASSEGAWTVSIPGLNLSYERGSRTFIGNRAILDAVVSWGGGSPTSGDLTIEGVERWSNAGGTLSVGGAFNPYSGVSIPAGQAYCRFISPNQIGLFSYAGGIETRLGMADLFKGGAFHIHIEYQLQ